MQCDGGFHSGKLSFASGTRLSVQPRECAPFLCVLCLKLLSAHWRALGTSVLYLNHVVEGKEDAGAIAFQAMA